MTQLMISKWAPLGVHTYNARISLIRWYIHAPYHVLARACVRMQNWSKVLAPRGDNRLARATAEKEGQR